jgi:hypothetical protein
VLVCLLTVVISIAPRWGREAFGRWEVSYVTGSIWLTEHESSFVYPSIVGDIVLYSTGERQCGTVLLSKQQVIEAANSNHLLPDLTRYIADIQTSRPKPAM